MSQQFELTFDEYSLQALETAQYPDIGGSGLPYVVFGLCGEAGEVAEKVKKLYRDTAFTGDVSTLTDEQKDQVAKEAGDCLWYLSELCRQLGVPLSKVAEMNIAKLRARKLGGKINGSGDSR